MTVAPAPYLRLSPSGTACFLCLCTWCCVKCCVALLFGGSVTRSPSVRALLLAPCPGHDLAGDRVRDLVICAELHGVGGPALGPRTQVGSVAEHVAQRHQSPYDVAGPPLFHALDLAPAGGKVPDDFAHVVLGRDHLDGHDRLEQDGA